MLIIKEEKSGHYSAFFRVVSCLLTLLNTDAFCCSWSGANWLLLDNVLLLPVVNRLVRGSSTLKVMVVVLYTGGLGSMHALRVWDETTGSHAFAAQEHRILYCLQISL